MTPLLSVRKLGKTYLGNVRALNGVSFDVQAGEFLVIVGLSGSGKSTLLRCLNRLTDPSSGEVFFHNQRIDRSQDVRTIRTKLAMIFQNFNLINRHSTLSNVLMGRLATTPTWKSILGLFTKADRDEAKRLLQLVGLEDKASVRVDQLSGGQQQRVAIARALCQKPEVILADEPVASLDPATCFTVMNYLRKINRELGITILCNLHFLSLAREYATRVIALRDGKIAFDGPPSGLTPEKFKEIYGEEAHEIQVN